MARPEIQSNESAPASPTAHQAVLPESALPLVEHLGVLQLAHAVHRNDRARMDKLADVGAALTIVRNRYFPRQYRWPVRR